MHTSNRLGFRHYPRRASVTDRTAVYGPVRTVVWQGSAGDRCPYADQFRLWKRFHSRKNSLFYQTQNGARVGDIFMSLIHTCQLCGADPFDYLTVIQRHSTELSANPREWMPWNYRKPVENGITNTAPWLMGHR